MKVLLVVSLEVFGDDGASVGQQIADVVRVIDPPHLPHFANEVRVVIGSDVDDTIQFLDGDPEDDG